MEQLLPAMKNVQNIERWDTDFFGDAEPFGETFNKGRFSCAKVADEGDDPLGGVENFNGGDLLRR